MCDNSGAKAVTFVHEAVIVDIHREKSMKYIYKVDFFIWLCNSWARGAVHQLDFIL